LQRFIEKFCPRAMLNGTVRQNLRGDISSVIR
jgi:hypothetical protein